jgi:hypothetical protein
MCGVENCQKQTHSKGYCQAHYRLFKKYGSPELKPKEFYKPTGPKPKPKALPIKGPRILKTHCVNGHEFNEDNTYLYGGAKHCRVCQRNRMRLRRPATVGKGGLNSSKTHCPQNHEYTDENTYTNPQGRRWCRACAKANGHVQKIKRYGITVEQYNEMLENQGYKCKICAGEFWNEVGSPNIDHNHSCCPKETSCGKCVRGLLCGECNQGLGRFKDNINFLYTAISYLSGNI